MNYVMLDDRCLEDLVLWSQRAKDENGNFLVLGYWNDPSTYYFGDYAFTAPSLYRPIDPETGQPVEYGKYFEDD